MQLFNILEYLFKRNIYSKKMWLSAALLLTIVLTLDSSWSLYIRPLLEDYNILPTTQATNRVPQNCWNYLTSTY